MNDCLFCKIIKKELPSKTIYEDQLIQVIMNINPLTNGHLLVLPKKHFTNILDIDEEFINHSFKIIKKELLSCIGNNSFLTFYSIMLLDELFYKHSLNPHLGIAYRLV